MKWKRKITILIIFLMIFNQWSALSVGAESSGASLKTDVEPTNSQYIIDVNTGVATAGVNINIEPQGVLGLENRKKPVDLIFMIDVSGSMNRGLVTGLLGSILGIDKQVEAAKKAAQRSIDNFKNKAIDGDRIGLLTFSDSNNEALSFNAKDQKKEQIIAHLTDMSSRVEGLKAEFPNLLEDTNLVSALKRAENMFGDSGNTKYIVLFTDGKIVDNSKQTVIKDVDGYYEPQICLLFCKKDYIKQDNVTITNNILGQRSEFSYNGKMYKYSKVLNVSDLIAIDLAEYFSEKNIKINTVEIRAQNNDEKFLSLLSTTTGGTFATASSVDDIMNNVEHIMETINQSKIRDIQLKINLHNVSLPTDGHVAIPEDSSAIKTVDGNYALVNIDDVAYNAGAGTPSGFNKLFTMQFDKPGLYSFKDVKLNYTNLAGESISVDAPFSINVIDTESFGLKFKNPPYVINVYKNPSKLTLDLNSEVEIVPPPGLTIEDIEKPTVFTWSSSDEKVAKVSSGIVTAVGVGTTMITVEAKDKKNNTIKTNAQVKVNLKGISFDKTIYEYTPGSSKNMFDELKAKPSGFNIFPTAFKWTVTGENAILTVDDSGNIKQQGSECGFVVLTAELKDVYKIDGDPVAPHDKATTLIKINKKEGRIGDPLKEW
ncbi:VWA domain-containing protein [Schinkia sp. CFF1]